MPADTLTPAKHCNCVASFCSQNPRAEFGQARIEGRQTEAQNSTETEYLRRFSWVGGGTRKIVPGSRVYTVSESLMEKNLHRSFRMPETNARLVSGEMTHADSWTLDDRQERGAVAPTVSGKRVWDRAADGHRGYGIK